MRKSKRHAKPTGRVFASALKERTRLAKGCGKSSLWSDPSLQRGTRMCQVPFTTLTGVLPLHVREVK